MKILILLLLSFNTLYAQKYMEEFFVVYYSNAKDGNVLTEQALIAELSNIQQKSLSSLSNSHKLIVQAYTEDAFVKLYRENASQISNEWKQKLNQVYDTVIKCTDQSTEFLTMLADLRSQIMIYKPLAELIQMSKQNLQDYENAIKQDKTYFNAYLGLALWYYFAPKIGGGNIGTTVQYLEQAEKYALTELQKFQLYVWRSQAYFRQKKKELSQQNIDQALAIYPHSSWLKTIQENNNKGKYFK
ncbi:MAG: hypothetical protein ACRC0X_00105 [Brevinema sp.]